MAQALPFIAAHIPGLGLWRLGIDGVKQIAINPGMPGFLLLEITEGKIAPDDSAPDTLRRFQVSPAQITFECGDPVEVPEPGQASGLVVARDGRTIPSV